MLDIFCRLHCISIKILKRINSSRNQDFESITHHFVDKTDGACSGFQDNISIINQQTLGCISRAISEILNWSSFDFYVETERSTCV